MVEPVRGTNACVWFATREWNDLTEEEKVRFTADMRKFREGQISEPPVLPIRMVQVTGCWIRAWFPSLTVDDVDCAEESGDAAGRAGVFKCKNNGLCSECRFYDVAGLKYFFYDGGKGDVTAFNSSVQRGYDYLVSYLRSRLYETKLKQLPLYFEILNARAVVGLCCNWVREEGPILYDITMFREEVDPNFRNDLIPSFNNCRYLYRLTTYAESLFKNENCSKEQARTGWADRCNGGGCVNNVNVSCPYYRGRKWLYVKDEYLDFGDKVLAEQIQELRWWSKLGEPWTEEEWKRTWVDPVIWAWTGLTEQYLRDEVVNEKSGATVGKTVYRPVVRPVGISDYRTGTVRVGGKVRVETGVEKKDRSINYPTIIKELSLRVRAPLRIKWPVDDFDDLTVRKATFHHFGYGSNFIKVLGFAHGMMGYSRICCVNTFFKPFDIRTEASNDKIYGMYHEGYQKKINNYLAECMEDNYISRWDCPLLYFTDYYSGSVFRFDEIPLEYNSVNRIAVFGYNRFGQWDVDYIDIDFKFYHSYLYQEYCHAEEKSYDNYFGNQIAKVKLNSEPVYLPNGNENRLIGLYPQTVLLEETEEEREVYGSDWYVFDYCASMFVVRLDPVKINRVFDFVIESVKLVKSPQDDFASEKEYELEFTSHPDGYGAPANIVFAFFTGDAMASVDRKTDRVVVKYKYKHLPDEGNLDINEEISLSNQPRGNEFVGIYGYLDSDGELVPIGKKKLYALVAIPNIKCRDIEILYQWAGADCDVYQVAPDRQRCIEPFVINDRPNPKINRRSSYSYRRNWCGDHDLSLPGYQDGMAKGPMWFPYNACAEPVYFDYYIQRPFPVLENYPALPRAKFVVGNNRLEIIPADRTPSLNEIPQGMERMRGPDIYKSYATTPGGSLNWCIELYRYWVRETRGQVFMGWVQPRGNTDIMQFLEKGEEPPKFGNEGREGVDILICMVRRGNYWHMAPDEFFHGNIVCSEELINPMHHLILKSPVEETPSIERRREKDLLKRVHRHNVGGYPTDRQCYKVYKIYNDFVMWAFPETWRFIERSPDVLKKAVGFSLSYPPYKHDTHLREILTSVPDNYEIEGRYSFVFRSPQMNMAGEVTRNAYIALYEGWIPQSGEDLDSRINGLEREIDLEEGILLNNGVYSSFVNPEGLANLYIDSFDREFKVIDENDPDCAGEITYRYRRGLIVNMDIKGLPVENLRHYDAYVEFSGKHVGIVEGIEVKWNRSVEDYKVEGRDTGKDKVTYTVTFTGIGKADLVTKVLVITGTNWPEFYTGASITVNASGLAEPVSSFFYFTRDEENSSGYGEMEIPVHITNSDTVTVDIWYLCGSENSNNFNSILEVGLELGRLRTVVEHITTREQKFLPSESVNIQPEGYTWRISRKTGSTDFESPLMPVYPDEAYVYYGKAQFHKGSEKRPDKDPDSGFCGRIHPQISEDFQRRVYQTAYDMYGEFGNNGVVYDYYTSPEEKEFWLKLGGRAPLEGRTLTLTFTPAWWGNVAAQYLWIPEWQAPGFEIFSIIDSERVYSPGGSFIGVSPVWRWKLRNHTMGNTLELFGGTTLDVMVETNYAFVWKEVGGILGDMEFGSFWVVDSYKSKN